MTRVRVEPRSFDQGRRKNDAFTHSATLPIRDHEVFNVVKELLKNRRARSTLDVETKFIKHGNPILFSK